MSDTRSTPMRAWIDSFADSCDEEIMMLPPEFDRAIAGLTECFEDHGRRHRVCYSYPLVLECLVEDQGMSEEEAQEWFDFNIIDAYLGPGMPCYLFRPSAEDLEETSDAYSAPV